MGRRRMICERAFRLAAIALLALGSVPFAPKAAFADCVQWRAPSPFVAIQDNGYWVTFYFKQNGSRLGGKAGYKTTARTVIGNIIGGVTGNRFFVRVLWTYSGVSSIGVYMGEVNSLGFIWTGSTYDEYARPPRVTGWKTQTPFTC
jgi:hypothetical protein